jgi:uncharacterized phage protein gp47/JayE
MLSDEYGLQDNEFRVKTLPVILAEKLELMRSLMGGRVSLQEDDPLYQFILADSIREERLWRLTSTLYQLMSISGASGTGLDRHGEDLGLPRGAGSRATVNLLITGTPGNTIPLGSIFETYEGIKYATTEAASLPNTIAVVRSTDNQDTLTSPYSGLVVVDWISDSQSGESPYTQNIDFIIDYDNNEIDWSPAGTQPDDGDTYYVRVSSSISVTVASESLIAGAFYNVPANTIIRLVSSVSGVTSVTNPLSSGVTGTDAEADSSYKLRLLRAARRNWTIERIKSKVDEIEDVISSKLFVGEAVDQNNLEEDLTLDQETLGQLFRPGERIGSISSVEFFIRVFGLPADLFVELYRVQLDINGNISYPATIASTRLAFSRIAPADIDPFGTTDWFEHKTELKYNHLDNTKQYMLLIFSGSENATNFYEFRYGDSGIYGYGGLYRDTVFFEDQNLYFKTWFPHASITTVAAPRTSLTDILRTEIDDVVDTTGKAVGIQHVIEEASVIRIQITGRINLISDDYTIVGVSNGIETRIGNMLAELEIGGDVLWSDMVWAIMEEPGVRDIDNIRILYKNPTDASFNTLAEQTNLRISDRQIARQDTVGVQFEEFWSGT